MNIPEALAPFGYVYYEEAVPDEDLLESMEWYDNHLDVSEFWVGTGCQEKALAHFLNRVEFDSARLESLLDGDSILLTSRKGRFAVTSGYDTLGPKPHGVSRNGTSIHEASNKLWLHARRLKDPRGDP